MRAMWRIVAAAGFGIVLMGRTSLPAQMPPAQPAVLQVPEFPRQFVGLPEFATATRKQTGAAAFVTKDAAGQYWLLSVKHRLDGLDPATVRGVFFKPFVGGAPLSLALSAFPVALPAGTASTAPLADLLVFRVAEFPPDQSMPLAAADPAVGDNVWIVGRMKSDTPDMRPLHAARISAVPNGDASQWLVADFYDPNIQSWGSGGAPVLNAKGEIVGVHSIHREANGKTQALIIPVSLVRSVLAVPAK